MTQIMAPGTGIDRVIQRAITRSAVGWKSRKVLHRKPRGI